MKKAVNIYTEYNPCPLKIKYNKDTNRLFIEVENVFKYSTLMDEHKWLEVIDCLKETQGYNYKDFIKE